jgi:hypothetical protein
MSFYFALMKQKTIKLLQKEMRKSGNLRTFARKNKNQEL